MKPQTMPPSMPAMIETGMATHGLASLSAMAAMVAHNAPTGIARGADVEQAALEADGHRQAGQHQRVALTRVLTIEFSEPSSPPAGPGRR